MQYKRIIEAVSSLSGNDAHMIQVFEGNFRSLISSLDMQLLLDGPIPPAILKNIITSSLQQLSEYAEQRYAATKISKYQILSHQLWNPLVSTLLTSSAVVAPRLEKRSSPTSLYKKVKKTSTLDSAFQHLSLNQDEQNNIRNELRKAPKKRPYSNKFHRHIKCVLDDCKFCLKMFQTVNITKCVGHKPCHNTGFYPHVGASLWQMIKNKHGKTECLLKPKACREGEIPSLQGQIQASRKRRDSTSSITSTRTFTSGYTDEEEYREPRSPIEYPQPDSKMARMDDISDVPN